MILSHIIFVNFLLYLYLLSFSAVRLSIQCAIESINTQLVSRRIAGCGGKSHNWVTRSVRFWCDGECGNISLTKGVTEDGKHSRNASLQDRWKTPVFSSEEHAAYGKNNEHPLNVHSTIARQNSLWAPQEFLMNFI